MTDFDLLIKQLDSLSDGVNDKITVMANAAALIYDTVTDINWAGFYIAKGAVLHLGPFIGRPACVKIPFGRGVCGAAAEGKTTVRVPDVELFPGHIACDSVSESELVIPLTVRGELLGVLDMDSPVKDRFSGEDVAGLEAFARRLEAILSELPGLTDADTVLEAIKERRSIRRFRPELPPRGDIEKIIEAGLYAASGKGLQATVTLAVTNREFRDELSRDNAGFWRDYEGDPFFGAPVILIVLANKKRPTAVYDGSLVIGNMMLAAHALGLGSIWIHRAKQEFETEKYKSFLAEKGILGEWEGIGHCCVGYTDGEPPEPAVRRRNRVFWVE